MIMLKKITGIIFKNDVLVYILFWITKRTVCRFSQAQHLRCTIGARFFATVYRAVLISKYFMYVAFRIGEKGGRLTPWHDSGFFNRHGSTRNDFMISFFDFYG